MDFSLAMEERMPREWVRPLWFLFTVGWFMALSLAVPSGVGFWLDRGVYDTAPLFTLIGLALGTVIALTGLYRMLKRFKAEANQENPAGKGGQQQK
jgi:F0F1-type ATP synthase assembly protein I